MDIQRLLSDFLGAPNEGRPGRTPYHPGDGRRGSSSGGGLMDQVGGQRLNLQQADPSCSRLNPT